MCPAYASLALFTGMPGPLELLIVAFVMLLLFGNRLPGVMRSMGRGVVEFKKGIQGIEDDLENSTKTTSAAGSSNTTNDA